MYAYYLVIDEDEGDTDFIFGTSCQARTGTMVYEGYTSGDATAQSLGVGVQATNAFSLDACLQFPKNVSCVIFFNVVFVFFVGLCNIFYIK